MSKKFLAGVIAVAGLAFAVSVSAAYDFGTTTLKVGSKGAAVMAVQTVVGATPVDGVFGPMTKAKVMAWQAANGLTADGVFGPASKAKANATVVTPTTPTTPTTPSTLKGGAGDSDYSAYSTGVKSSIKDGEEDVKVAAVKIEAVDSDIAVNNIKVELKTKSGTLSTKVSKYFDSIDIYQGSEKVGSADVADFSKDGSTYTKSIALSNAVISADEKEAFFVVANAVSDIDEDNDDGKITVSIVSYRFTDGSGVVSTTDAKTGDYIVTKDITLDLSTANDVTLKSSSSNPSDATIAVDEDTTTDDVLALAFKIDNDEDSTSDATLISLPVVLTFADNATDAGDNWAEKVIESVNVKIDGEEYEAEYALADDDTTGAGGTATYTVDLDGEDLVIATGDTAEVKVYLTFAEQKDNYDSAMTVKASVDASEFSFEDEDGDDMTGITGAKSGALLTLSVSPALITGITATSKTDTDSKVGTFTFKFTVEADGSDVALSDETIKETIIKPAGATVTPAFSIMKTSGTVKSDYVAGTSYTVEDGNKASFTVTYTLDPSAGAGQYYVTLDEVAGVNVDETAGPESLVL